MRRDIGRQHVGYLAFGEPSGEQAGDLVLTSGQLGGHDRARGVAQRRRERVSAGTQRSHPPLLGEAAGVGREDQRLGPVPVAAPAQHPGQLEPGPRLERRQTGALVGLDRGAQVARSGLPSVAASIPRDRCTDPAKVVLPLPDAAK
jgi:hypothetical protein